MAEIVKGDNDDDIPQLSLEAYLALQEFYKEEERNAMSTGQFTNGESDIDIAEDWQQSQFWYNSETIQVLTSIALKSVEADGKVALISCPSLYKKLKLKSQGHHTVHLYEFDTRFAIYTDFIFYDYKSPLDVPPARKNYYDLVIADPPFLSEECLIKTSATINMLTKKKIILCTGSVMGNVACGLLKLHKSAFVPSHKSKLANDFQCYTNFDINILL